MEDNNHKLKKVGLIVNPIAGMGGSVGLKGTDGDIYKKAIQMGAKPVAPDRINQFLSDIESKRKVQFLTAPGKMGGVFLQKKSFSFRIIGEIGKETSANDTKRIAKLLLMEDIDLIVFCGGDGTARDIYDAIGLAKPVIAIPSGVKMYSPVFALNPNAAAEIFNAFLINFIELVEREVLDINEELYRKGILDTNLYGYLNVPKIPDLLQGGKDSSGFGKTIEDNKSEIAQYVIELMENDILYLLGPGTTVKSITDHLNLPKTLLGVDALLNGRIIGMDLNERGILALLKKYENRKIIITPIGGQGFTFGRGNKQFTPNILKMVGTKNTMIISTREKMKNIKCLRIDTGDEEVDLIFKGLYKIFIGYKEELIIGIE